MAAGKIGIIAGNGDFPAEFIRAAKASGRSVVAVAHKGESEKAIEKLADAIVWIRLGQFQQIIDALKTHACTEVVFLGGISKASFFAGVIPDALALKLISRIASRTDDNLLRAFAKELETQGIHVVASTPFLHGMTAPAGVLGAEQPTAEEALDIRYGLDLALNLGRFDVGQTVVVKDRTPVALEALEGTDACIARAGALVKVGGTVVVKVVKPGQDHRFDLPAAGPRTVEICAKHRVRVLAVQAGGTLLIQREKMIQLANKAKIVLVGVEPGAAA